MFVNICLQHLWDSAHNLLLNQQCSPNKAGQFFYDWGRSEDPILSSGDRFELLSRALSWWKGKHNEEINKWPNSKDTQPVPNWRPLAFLDELESEVLHISVVSHTQPGPQFYDQWSSLSIIYAMGAISQWEIRLYVPCIHKYKVHLWWFYCRLWR